MKIIEQFVTILDPTTRERGIEALKLVEYAGRNCYQSHDKTTDDSYIRFNNTLIERGHHSPLEFAHATFRIITSRDVMAEITRHRMASFCVSGETVVGYDSRSKGITIAELYRKTHQYQKLTKLRSIDEKSKEIIRNPIVDVFDNGNKETYLVETEDGYSVRATLDHQFLTTDGWKKLSDIKVGDKVYTNGIPAYQQKDWLYQKYNIENMSQKNIGILCSVTADTIRKWVRVFGLQKPIGSWCVGKEPPNKGKNKTNYPPMQKTSQALVEHNRLHPRKNPRKMFYETSQGHLETKTTGYNRVDRYYPKTGICSVCGDRCKTEVHHKNKDPKDFTDTNLVELCVACHKRIHKGYAVKAVKPSVVKSITYYGEERVYDIEMKGPYHNYIANGFVVHNCIQSQRYVLDDKSGEISFIKPNFYVDDNGDKVDAKLWCASRAWRQACETAETFYKNLVQNYGLPPQDARKVLPNSTATVIVMQTNLRELLHIIELRNSPRAYPEMQTMMKMLIEEVRRIFPEIIKKEEKSE